MGIILIVFDNGDILKYSGKFLDEIVCEGIFFLLCVKGKKVIWNRDYNKEYNKKCL